MISVIIALLLSLAISQETTTYEISNKKINFYNNEQLRVLSSEKCVLSKDGKSCKNFGFLKKVSIKKLGEPEEGGANPGSLICEAQLNGKIVMGYDSSQNQISFCKISSGVLIDNGTLSYYGHLNDGHIKKKRKALK